MKPKNSDNQVAKKSEKSCLLSTMCNFIFSHFTVLVWRKSAFFAKVQQRFNRPFQARLCNILIYLTCTFISQWKFTFSRTLITLQGFFKLSAIKDSDSADSTSEEESCKVQRTFFRTWSIAYYHIWAMLFLQKITRYTFPYLRRLDRYICQLSALIFAM